MAYNVTFEVKDRHNNPLGAALVVDEFTTADWEKGTLNGLNAIANNLVLAGELVAYYDEGKEGVDWVVGYLQSAASTDYSKQDDHLYLNAFGYPAVTTYVTDVKVDLTDVETIEVDWSKSGNTSTESRAYFTVSENKGTSYEDSVATLVYTSNFARRINVLNVSALSGDYYLRVHAVDTRTTGLRQSTVRCYGVSGKDSYGETIKLESVSNLLTEGNYISPPTDLSAFGITEPELRIGWWLNVPTGATLTVETAVTDSDTVNPAEEDWVAQINWELITGLPADLTGKYLYTRVKATGDGVVTPVFEWLVSWDDDGTDIPYAAVRIDFNEEIKIADVAGEAVFEGVAAGENQPYSVYILKLNAPYVYVLLTEGTVTVVDQNITEEVIIANAQARLTNIGIQADYFEGPPEARVTNIGLQIELGEYYSLAKPIRTRPRPAAARTVPVSPRSRVGLM